MIGVHHTAIVTTDVERSLRFWCDGMGLKVMFDHVFTGNWPALFDAETHQLRSVFIGDPQAPDTGIVELVVFGRAGPTPARTVGPVPGFFLLSFNRDVDATLRRLADLSFSDDVRRIVVPAPNGKHVDMAVITAPDGVRVELIGAPR